MKSSILRWLVAAGACAVLATAAALAASRFLADDWRAAYPDAPFSAAEKFEPPAKFVADGTAEEKAAIEAVAGENYVRAREVAEKILAATPDSVPGLFALAEALSDGFGILPKALNRIRACRRILEERGRARPDDAVARAWYFWALRVEYDILGALDQQEPQLRVVDLLERVAWPMPVLRAWPLMKLRRWDEAEQAIADTLKNPNQDRQLAALNTRGALENERRHRVACYDVFEDLSRKDAESAVVWNNLGDAALGVFRHDQAERAFLEGTKRKNDFQGSPWRNLADLYVTEGRFPEAVEALRRTRTDRAARKPSTLQQDQAVTETSIATLLVALGRGADAERFARRVYGRPDRSGHTSADPRFLELDGALLMHAVLRLRLEEMAEAPPASPAAGVAARADGPTALEWEDWFVRHRATKLLQDDTLIVEFFRPYLVGGLCAEPWLAGTAVRLLPAGVALDALRRARAAEDHPGAEPYFDALEAEATLADGDAGAALAAARRALEKLPAVGEKLLRARVAAVAAEAARRTGDRAARLEYLATVLRDCPAVVRLVGVVLPVQITDDGSPLAARTARLLRASPRFEADADAFAIKVLSAGERVGWEMTLRTGTRFFEGGVPAGKDADAVPAQAAAAFFRQLMSPTLDLTQVQINSLDGSPSAQRNQADVDDLVGPPPKKK